MSPSVGEILTPEARVDADLALRLSPSGGDEPRPQEASIYSKEDKDDRNEPSDHRDIEAPAESSNGHSEKTEKDGDKNIVDFDGPDDPDNPRNWSLKRKLYTTGLYSATTFGATFASSVYSGAIEAVANEYHISSEVSTLGLSLFVLGFAVGPIVFSPIGELYGRKISVLAPYFVFGLFSIATATAENIQTVFLCRFFGGVFASAPVSNVGGIMGDLFAPKTRGSAVVFYASMVVGGPTLAPLVSSVIVMKGLSWRYTEYFTSIWIFCILILDMVFIRETYNPTILARKASKLRRTTQNWALHAKCEETTPSMKEVMEIYMGRPIKMLFLEPILVLVCVYASFVFGILYLFIAAFPIIFQEGRGWNPVVGSLPFLSVLLGIFTSGGINILNQTYYIKRLKQNGGKPVPEARLPPMMFGSVVFPAGLIIMAWTSMPNIPWIAPIIAAYLVGVGFLSIFQMAINYLIDTYGRSYASSAVGANTILRSFVAAGFPMAAQPMFRNMGTQWALTMLACIAAVMIPIPFLFFIYGPRIRALSRYK